MKRPLPQNLKIILFPLAMVFFLMIPKLAQSQDLVSITSPSGTEEKKFGETIPITWVNGDVSTSDRISFFYSKDGGDFILISTLFLSQLVNTGNESTFNWTIPDQGADADSEFRIRVFNQTRSVSDTSNAFRVYYEPSVSISSPSGIEEKKFGETVPITWTNGDVFTNDRLSFFYSKEGGDFILISTLFLSQLVNTGNESTFNWTIPDQGADADSEFRIRVFNQTRSVSDTSNAFRVYYEPSVSISSPSGIEEKKFGETVPITWTNGDVFTNDRLSFFYSKEGGDFILIRRCFFSLAYTRVYFQLDDPRSGSGC